MLANNAYVVKQLRETRNSNKLRFITFVQSTLQKISNPSIFLLIIAIYTNPMDVRDP